MIVIDTDLVVIDQRYKDDDRYGTNAQVLAALGGIAGITAHNLLEVVGILSHNLSANVVPGYPRLLLNKYRLTPFPSFDPSDQYADLTVGEVMRFVGMKMSCGDAVTAAVIVRYVPRATAFLTWNAKHFAGKLPIPVLTPADWLAANPPPATP